MNETNLVKYNAKDGQQITLSYDIVRRFLIQGNADAASDQEIMYFMGICKSRGLNPFKKDAYLIKYGQDPAAIVTSIDYFRSRANAHPNFQGYDCGIIVQDENGKIRDSYGLILPGEKLLGGFFSCLPKNHINERRHEVNLDAYIKKTRDGKITRFWQPENQPMMISKVAESQGLRKVFPDEFSGMYDEDEIRMETPVEQVVAEKSKAKLEQLKNKVSHTQYIPETAVSALSPNISDTISIKDNMNAIPEIWKRENWINLKSKGFRDLCVNNLDTFDNLNPAMKNEIRQKWQSMFPGSVFGTAESKQYESVQKTNGNIENGNKIFDGLKTAIENASENIVKLAEQHTGFSRETPVDREAETLTKRIQTLIDMENNQDDKF